MAQLALRGGGAGDAERDVPGGARHRQRPLLGALRLRQVRTALLPQLRRTCLLLLDSIVFLVSVTIRARLLTSVTIRAG